MPSLRILLAVLLLGLSAPAAADAASYAPPRGQVFHSGVGGYDAGAVAAFAEQSGKHPAVFQYFASWRAERRDVNWFRGLLEKASAARSRVLLSISTKDTSLTPRSIAAGEGDAFLLAINGLTAEHGHPTYLRLLSEMNNANNPYAAYDARGRSRGRAVSPRAFRRAWKRAVLVVRGGEVAVINGKLRRLRLPPVRTAAKALPRPPVAFAWVPLSFGNPEIARNHPRHWWPGRRYVDWVGSTWYSPFPNAQAFDRFSSHPAWRGKPFMFAEYGVWGPENPGFIRNFFAYVRAHPRVGLVSYYQSALLKPEFRLSSHPRSRAALREQMRSPRLIDYAPEYR